MSGRKDGGFLGPSPELQAEIRRFWDEENRQRGWKPVYRVVSEEEHQAHLLVCAACARIESSEPTDGEPVLPPTETWRVPAAVARLLPRVILMREDLATGERTPLCS